jgi:glycosyltransferase involved in cell wall biosynthesis
MQRWASGLVSRGLKVHLLTAHDMLPGVDQKVTVHRLKSGAPWAYLLSAKELSDYLDAISPDLLNVHYATGYGLLARVSRFHPTLLSVWGSDVYDFPDKSALHRWLLRGNLQSAEAVASTSECMARRTSRVFPPKRLFITPFGVDERLFKPVAPDSGRKNVVIGTVKTLSKKYGIDILIRAFALAAKELGASTELSLEISGAGPDEAMLKELAVQLGIASAVTFHGAVPHARVPKMLQRLDIFAALSHSESFGVAAVEAAACGLPVVVSDADGLAEVTLDGQTGLVVPKRDHQAAASALVRLAKDKALRQKLGAAGRQHVLRHYTWSHSLDTMIAAYKTVISEHTATLGLKK